MRSRVRSLLKEIVSASDEGADCSEIRKLLSRRVALDLVASEGLAVGHILGFTQIRLGDLDGRVVRVHFWPKGSDPVHDVHSHKWPMKSYILSGTMENSLFFVEPDANAHAALYEVTYHSGGTRRVFTGMKVRAELAKIDRATRGEFYEMNLEAFHDSNVTSDGAITLIISGEPADRPPLVVGPAADPSWPEFPLASVGAAELNSLFALLRKELTT